MVLLLTFFTLLGIGDFILMVLVGDVGELIGLGKGDRVGWRWNFTGGTRFWIVLVSESCLSGTDLSEKSCLYVFSSSDDPDFC